MERMGQYNDYSNYGYNKTLNMIDYKMMKFKTVSMANYNCDGSVIRTYDFQGDWHRIVPGSVMELTVDSLIKKYNLR